MQHIPLQAWVLPLPKDVTLPPTCGRPFPDVEMKLKCPPRRDVAGKVRLGKHLVVVAIANIFNDIHKYQGKKKASQDHA